MSRTKPVFDVLLINYHCLDQVRLNRAGFVGGSNS